MKSFGEHSLVFIRSAMFAMTQSSCSGDLVLHDLPDVGHHPQRRQLSVLGIHVQHHGSQLLVGEDAVMESQSSLDKVLADCLCEWRCTCMDVAAPCIVQVHAAHFPLLGLDVELVRQQFIRSLGG